MSYSTHQLQIKERFIQCRGSWDDDWESVLKLHPDYLEAYLNIRDISQRRNRLPPKIQEFIYIAVAACTTHIHHPAIRGHIKAALTLGASIEEIREVVGLTYLVGIHTVTLGAPILLKLLKERSVQIPSNEIESERKEAVKQSFIRKRGFWTETWNPLLEIDADFFESYVNFSGFASQSSTLEPKYREIIVCAFDVSTHHLYARGTEIHMRNALELGASPAEITEMLEITSLAGMHGVTTSLAVLDEVTREKPQDSK